MPREKQFDVDAALERALHTFWARGYEATSMDVLLRRMGIHRGSFYDTFGSKRDVLLRALKRYDARNRAATMREVAAGRSPREALVTIFRAMVDGSLPQGRHGCFLVNTSLELAPRDPQVARIARRGFADMERFFAGLVRRGQRSGEISRKLHAARTGRTLMNHMVGLMVLVRARAPHATQLSVVKEVEHLLA